MANYSSDNINVFPTSRRGSNIDIQSKFNTEKNITSLVNRLTDIKSFVINGIIDNAHVITPLNTPNGTPTIQIGSININGYIFKLNETKSLGTPKSTDKYLAFKITTQTNNTFTELVGNDQNNSYSGLTINYFTDVTSTTTESGDYYLPIAEKVGGVWKMSNCFVKFDGSEIKLDYENDSRISDKNLQLNTNLKDWLVAAFVIDDGEL